jgi:hypothetical protein
MMTCSTPSLMIHTDGFCLHDGVAIHSTVDTIDHGARQQKIQNRQQKFKIDNRKYNRRVAFPGGFL